MIKIILGTFNTPDGNDYNGEWVNDIRKGNGIKTYLTLGIQIYSNGDKYEGQWENNMKNGNGKE